MNRVGKRGVVQVQVQVVVLTMFLYLSKLYLTIFSLFFSPFFQHAFSLIHCSFVQSPLPKHTKHTPIHIVILFAKNPQRKWTLKTQRQTGSVKKRANVTGGSGGGGGGGAVAVCCQVEKCGTDLKVAKRYYRRHKVCEDHAKSPLVVVGGIRQRFCQQCSRFHELSEFDEMRRSCRSRLAGHNERRRKLSASETNQGATSSHEGAIITVATHPEKHIQFH